MQQATCILTGFTLVTAMTFGITAMAADPPKEGTFSGTYAGAGTFLKTYPVGKERSVSLWEDNSFTVGKGFLDHMTWHCVGTRSIMTGVGQFSGYCVVTDPTGDQIAADIASDGIFPADAKTTPAKGTFTTGTGKYAGISSSLTNVLHPPAEFRTAAEGIFANYDDFQATYKLP
jgi:hypothetical protein